jgi:hypothetical protein
LNDAFDECGVEQFTPKIGSDYRNAQGVADNPRVVHSNDSVEAFSITEILEAGYRFRDNPREIIVPARVCISVSPQQQGG